MEKFGKYILAKLLAKGGMAEVFLAREFGISGFQRLLAIKRVLPHLAKDHDFIEMFTAEARLSAQLNHPNIVQIYDFGLIDSSYYIAMEFIDGVSLNDLLSEMSEKDLALPIELSVLILADLCQGLGYAHNKRSLNNEPLDIVHRDISPKNVMLSYEGAVKLMDFGIAKAADQQRKETVTGVIKGKISYLSPEQVMGEKLDRRSDIFALGIVFFEMLTSQRCFSGDNEFAILFKIRSAQVPPASSINPHVPPELDAIVAKMLHPEKDLRYQTVEEVIEDLNQFRYKFGYLATSGTLSGFLRASKGADESNVLATLREIDWEKVERELSVQAAEVRQATEEATAASKPKKPKSSSNTMLRQSAEAKDGTIARRQKTRPNKFKDETRVDFEVPQTSKGLFGIMAIVLGTVALLATGVVFALVILPKLTGKVEPTPTPIVQPQPTPIPAQPTPATGTTASGPTAVVVAPSPAPPLHSPTPTVPPPTPTQTPIPPTPTPKRPTTGTVVLTSSVGLDVFEDSQRLGKLSGTGLKIQLPPGSHTFTVSGYTGSGYYRTQVSADVVAGQSVTRQVPFPEMGSLKILTALTAVVYINNTKIDDTPIDKLDITAGIHEIRFEFKNGASSRQKVTVRAGQFTQVFGKP